MTRPSDLDRFREHCEAMADAQAPVRLTKTGGRWVYVYPTEPERALWKRLAAEVADYQGRHPGDTAMF